MIIPVNAFLDHNDGTFTCEHSDLYVHLGSKLLPAKLIIGDTPVWFSSQQVDQEGDVQFWVYLPAYTANAKIKKVMVFND